MIATLTRDELKAKIDRKDRFAMVETLRAVSYQQWHLSGAVNLPPDRVADLALSVLPDKRAEIVVYCGSPT